MVITLDRACVSFEGGSGLHDVSLTLGRHDRGLVFGPSGAGKTTLLKVLAGFQKLDAGAIHWRTEEVGFGKPHHARPTLVWQEPTLMVHRSALANLLLPLEIRGRFRRQIAQQLAMTALTSVGLESRAKTETGKLSQGEKQRLSVARALILEPTHLLADEPTAHLDAVWAERIGTLLLRAHRRGTTLLVATHDQHLAQRLDANLKIELDAGRIKAIDYQPTGAADNNKSKPALQYLHDLKPSEALS